ncbi:hypothetical protein HYE82_11685 [Streptomyces sp. BR123]|uniref:hypothetical protein n=1 Tax=Streptomyces sp. BR123 TaxID=2749828 RepID=UPI0015C43486|nr:hypothetical protein [Streptomyces sp. BR123]NXY95046.1 hypothetical protein [Streptomyces sp. BR123]
MRVLVDDGRKLLSVMHADHHGTTGEGAEVEADDVPVRARTAGIKVTFSSFAPETGIVSSGVEGEISESQIVNVNNLACQESDQTLG